MTYKPGESGNPGGRPAVVRDFRERCGNFMSEEGWKRLSSMARGRGKHAYRALELIAAYAYGKPNQPISGPDNAPLQITIQALVADITHAASRLAAGDGSGEPGPPALVSPEPPESMDP